MTDGLAYDYPHKSRECRLLAREIIRSDEAFSNFCDIINGCETDTEAAAAIRNRLIEAAKILAGGTPFFALVFTCFRRVDADELVEVLRLELSRRTVWGGSK